jgi:hypothetical protein
MEMDPSKTKQGALRRDMAVFVDALTADFQEEEEE